MALVGYQQQLASIQSKIDEIEAELRGTVRKQKAAPKTKAKAKGKSSGKKRVMSPEALERIRAAQKKRWAAFKKAKKAEGK